MDFSKGYKSECRREAIEVQERVMADLMAIGYKSADAYVAAFGYQVNLSDDYLKGEMERIISKQNFNKYFNKSQHRIEKRMDKLHEEEEKIELIDKDQVLKEILALAYKLPKNDPKRIEMLMKYADLQQMKKDEVKDEDTTVHYYLPLSCYNCSLYLEEKRGINK